ncbi:NifB/NifX family molybdenum-iron cluster-binding protein [Candidatus Micrarchaeota archaeon]|nr:NifB/NifX family molybdenum-iron cluster-binding protein [Candidatus Micrarchaeota archaeon]
MKIAVSTSEGGLKDSICPVFGRCPTFTVINTKENNIGKVDIIANPGGQAGGGAGVAAAQAVIDAGVEAVITGNCGPNALAVLLQAGVRIYSSAATVEDAVKELLAGKLSAVNAPTAPGHFGMGFGRGRMSGRGTGFKGGRP